jgi:hypothetical protein
MATKKKMLQAAAGNAGGAGLNVEDVFSTYLFYSSNSISPVTVTNNIDLAGEGGMVWVKSRTDAGANPTQNNISDTERGTGNKLITNGTYANIVSAYENCSAFNSDGFAYADGFGDGTNKASWTFRKAPKFFTCVQYTGVDAPQTISHNLGSIPGCIIVKRTDTTSDWAVYHRGIDATSPQNYWMKLNNTDAREDYDMWYDTAPTATEFSVRLNGTVNEGGGTYVAYLFAHNDGDGEFGPDGDADIIKCGSYTGNGSTDGPEIDLGFEPQWVLIKNADIVQNWYIIDNMRGMAVNVTDGDATLLPNTSGSENAANIISPLPNGFKITASNSQYNGSGNNIVYIAIRRGTKVPESASEVFDVYAGNDAYPTVITTGFTVDSLLGALRSGNSNNFISGSRLTGSKSLITSSTAAQGNGLFSGSTNACFMRNDGILPSTFGSSNTVYYSWKRAPGFFDVVAYTGNATAGRTVPHNLGVAPELMIAKTRDAANYWVTYDAASGPTKFMILNQTNGTQTSIDHWNNTAPTASVFTVGDGNYTNRNATQHIIYLFASLPGISKVGSYTGDGTTDGSKVIDCGFSNSARFVLIKTSSHSDPWLVFDSVRGIVSSGNDPYLRLNDTSAEQAGLDVLDPQSSGFGVRGNLTNVNNYTYIFYAIA